MFNENDLEKFKRLDLIIKGTLDDLLSGNIEGLEDYKIIISHEPGSQRLINLIPKFMKKKYSGYESAFLKLESLKKSNKYSLDFIKDNYRYDMQTMLIYIDHEKDTIYIIDGQQRLTMHFTLKMYLNIVALQNKDSNLSKTLQSEAGVNVNKKFTFSKPNFYVKTLNEFNIEITDAEGDITSVETISDFQKLTWLYNKAINRFRNTDFSIEDFVIYMESNLIKTELNSEGEEVSYTENSLYFNYFKTLITIVLDSPLGYDKLHEASHTIRVNLDLKSPFETIPEALIRIGNKPADMNASTFCLSSMFMSLDNDIDRRKFNDIYKSIMNASDSIETKNDYLIQILVSKYNSLFVSKNLSETKNIFTAVEAIQENGLIVLSELKVISDIYFYLTASITTASIETLLAKIFTANFLLKLKDSEVSYQLLRLIKEHNSPEKTLFVAIPVIVRLLEIEKSFNILKSTSSIFVAIEKYLRAINLFFMSKRDSINNLKQEEVLFFEIGNKILSTELSNIKSAFELSNIQSLLLSVSSIVSMSNSMEEPTWKGTILNDKSYIREGQLGNAGRVNDLPENKEFYLKFSGLNESSTTIKTILLRYFAKKVSDIAEEFDHFTPVNKIPTVFEIECEQKKSLNTVINRSANRTRRKGNDITLLSNDSHTSNCIYYAKESGLITGKREDTRSLASLLKVERVKDFIYRNRDIIIGYKEIESNIDFSISKIFLGEKIDLIASPVKVLKVEF